MDLEKEFSSIAHAYSFDGKLYGIPDRSGAAILYYNKGMFDAKGIEYPTIDWTWDNFFEAAKACTDGAGHFGHAGMDWWPIWFSIVEQNGGHVINPETGAPEVNSPQAIEALQWVQDLCHKHHVIPTAVEYADMGPEMSGDGAFIDGRVAMATTGFWLINSLVKANQEQPGKIDWGIAPMFHNKNKAVSAFGSALTIPRASKNPDAAWEIIQFLTSPEGQRPIASQGQDVPANVSVQESDTFLKPEWMAEGESVDLQAFPDSADMIFTPNFLPEWDEVQKDINDASADFWQGKKTAQEFATDLQGRLEKTIKSAK